MMHTDSEQTAIDIMNAMKVNSQSDGKKREDKATLIETRYEKWKRSKKAKSQWSYWCCCCKKSYSESKNLDTAPLTANKEISSTLT